MTLRNWLIFVSHYKFKSDTGFVANKTISWGSSFACVKINTTAKAKDIFGYFMIAVPFPITNGVKIQTAIHFTWSLYPVCEELFPVKSSSVNDTIRYKNNTRNPLVRYENVIAVKRFANIKCLRFKFAFWFLLNWKCNFVKDKRVERFLCPVCNIKREFYVFIQCENLE